MTEATEKKPVRRPRRNAQDSIPVYQREMVLNSHQAQRIIQRGFRRTARALYSIDVILRIIGDADEATQVEEMITNLINEEYKAIQQEKSRLEKIIKDNGIDMLPEYTHPEKITLPISSPQSSRFVAIIQELDELMRLIDTLWLNHIMTNSQRGKGTWRWQTRILGLGRRIVNIEMRARKAARTSGKGEAVDKELGASESKADVAESGTDADKNAKKDETAAA